MAALYEIDAQIMDCIDMETGEIIDAGKLEELEMEREKKIENVALWYKNLLSDAEAYRAEKNSFAEKEKAAKNRAESLKRYLEDALGGGKFKTAKVSISYRRSESVTCESLDAVPKKYLVMTPSLDKTVVKEILKNGRKVRGCVLTERQNLQIK